MRDSLNKNNVLIEVTEPEPLIIVMKRRKFVRARVLQVGSEVIKELKPGDNVMAFNEGKELIDGPNKARVVNELSIVLKFT